MSRRLLTVAILLAAVGCADEQIEDNTKVSTDTAADTSPADASTAQDTAATPADAASIDSGLASDTGGETTDDAQATDLLDAGPAGQDTHNDPDTVADTASEHDTVTVADGIADAVSGTDTVSGTDIVSVADAAADSGSAPDAGPGKDAGPIKLPPVKVPTHTASGAWIDPPVEATWTYNYGFVSTMLGKIAIIDLAKPKHIATIGNGNKLVHGAAVDPMQKSIWVPNFNDGSLERFESLSKDMTVWKKTKSVKIPVLELGQVRGARDGSVIGVTAGIMPVQGTGFNDPKKAEKAKIVALFWPKTGKVKTFKLDSPVPIEVSTRGSTVYVGNWSDNSITIIDTKKEKVVGSWQIEQQGNKWDWLGPSHIQLSWDNRKLVTANLFDNSIGVFDVGKPEKSSVYAKLGKVAHWAEFSPDDSKIYCVRWDKLPDATNEKGNPSIKVDVQVRDAVTLKLLKTFKWDYLLSHTAVPPPTSKFATSVFVMGSFGSVLRFDAKSYKLTGQALVTTNMAPPAMTMMF